MSENSLEVRNTQELNQALIESDNIIMKKYMNFITDYSVKDISTELAATDVNSMVRLNKIEKLVFDAEENNQDKLMNVYNAVALCGGSIINVIVSDGKTVEYYLGAKSPDINKIVACQTALSGTFEGNFPGSEMTAQKKSGLTKCIDTAFSTESEERNKVVSVVCGIPALRNEENRENSKFVQGIEKIIDSLKGQKYALITISDPINPVQVHEIVDGYEALYTQLSPFATTALTYSESDSDAVAETITDSITKTMGTSITNTITNSTSSTAGQNKSRTKSVTPFGIGFSFTKGTSTSFTRQDGTSIGDTRSDSVADSRSTGKTDTYTYTSGRTLQINAENKKVKNLLEKIENQIARIEEASDLGLWNTATYCIADDSQTSRILANAVEAICRGEKNTIESFAVATWDNSRKGNKVIEYLKKFSHPVLEMEAAKKRIELNPTSLISGKELVIEAGLPQKSVIGVPVSEMVSFARNVVSEADNEGERISLGNIYHMGNEEQTAIELNVESMSAHTLITGSTGCGKSNTVYQLMNELSQKGIKFLIIEPAKGEYKHVFGNRKDVMVYGTNAKLAELLRINPFAFPESIHVLEHIDRLIEIFNVCWPMYAAMPAVLKDAVLMAYENCGWDLSNSENIYGEDVYPTFRDLQEQLVAVINRSAYSEEVKGNYIGSLVTRIKSLTNGLNGKMFTDKAIPESELFDENVIVDLSRVGSAETKSLIMGLLVMKLNEYRMHQAGQLMNQKLKHVTVLEEAHNLLKNAVTTPGDEGGSLSGKSVEMISNSIAEMRTYGEGFVIVDQSPSAIDISAIRNTNTKIIMRLPEESDRKQAGKSAALKENQIDELAKLHRGVAVVYQNDWLDPVLCKIHKVDIQEEAYQYKRFERPEKKDYTELLSMLMSQRVNEKIDYNLDNIEKIIEDMNISTHSKLMIRKAIEENKHGKKPELCKENSFAILSGIVVDIVGCEDKLLNFVAYGNNSDLLQQELNREIERCAWSASKELKLAVSQCIVHEIVEKDHKQIEMYTKWREYAVEQRKVV